MSYTSTLVLLLHLIYLSYLSNVYCACSFFYEFRKIRYFIQMLVETGLSGFAFRLTCSNFSPNIFIGLLDHEDGDSLLLRNIDKHLPWKIWVSDIGTGWVKPPAVNSALKLDIFPVKFLLLLANNGKQVIMFQTKQDKAYCVWL
jgi:hypothetical protein